MVRTWLNAAVLSPLILLGGASAAQTDIPPDHQVLVQSGHAIQTQLPHRFKLLVWNVHKAEGGPVWQRDFHRLSLKSDLILLQEGYRVRTYDEVTGQLPDILWSFATSFVHQGFDTGVVTGSSTKPLKTSWLRSPGREPIVNSPKMTIVSEFDLPGRQEHLLVANIHAINFVMNGTFYEQISQVLKAFESHHGPIIFAGDFNTWNEARLSFLKSRAEQQGLKMVTFQKDSRLLALDHVFYRGLRPTKMEILDHIDSSDHFPLHLEFSTDRTN